MKNFVQKGDSFQAIAPAAVTGGTGFLLATGVFVVAIQTAASGASVEVLAAGVVDHAKAAGAITQGALAYWDDTAKVVTTTSSGNTKIGIFTNAAASADATARVRLNGTF